jgi:uncharacterized protein YjbI with pentapeptide repeats
LTINDLFVDLEVNGYKIKPGANLAGANLSGAYLKGANLEGVTLACTYLQGAAMPHGPIIDYF